MDIAQNTLVDSIYEAAGDADQWGEVLQNFGKWAGGFGGLYYLINKATGQFDAIHTGGHTTEAELSYVGYYSALDPHAGVVALTPERTWFLSQEHFTPEFFQTDRFFREFFYTAWCALGDGNQALGRRGYSGLYRTEQVHRRHAFVSG